MQNPYQARLRNYRKSVESSESGVFTESGDFGDFVVSVIFRVSVDFSDFTKFVDFSISQQQHPPPTEPAPPVTT